MQQNYRTRRQIAIAVISAFFGVLLLLTADRLGKFVLAPLFDALYLNPGLIYPLVYIFAFALLGVAVFTLLLLYLRGAILSPRSVELGGLGTQIYFEESSGEVGPNKQVQEDASVSVQLDSINTALRDLKDLGGVKNSSVTLSDDEKASLLNALKASMEEGLGEEVLKIIESKYSDALLEGTRFSELKQDLLPIKIRLSEEVDALGRRNNINLALGVITTLAAVGILGYMVWGNRAFSVTDTTALLSYYVPRLSLAVFIQVFAYFFLRLYRSGLDEIKYFQNELTNVEMKLVALEAAVLLGQTQAFDSTIVHLAQTERNFILKQGESTVGLEEIKANSQQTIDVLDTLSRALADVRGLNKP